MTLLFFAYCALVSIVAGVLTVALRNPVHCGIALLALLGHIAGLFVLLHAEFLLVLLASRYSGMKGPATTKAVETVGNSTAIGILMFSDYLLPFEIVGVFLLGAIVGAIVLAKTPTASEVRGGDR